MGKKSREESCDIKTSQNTIHKTPLTVTKNRRSEISKEAHNDANNN
jgi:hypothetical protein